MSGAPPDLPLCAVLPGDFGRFPGKDGQWKDEARPNFVREALAKSADAKKKDAVTDAAPSVANAADPADVADSTQTATAVDSAVSFSQRRKSSTGTVNSSDSPLAPPARLLARVASRRQMEPDSGGGELFDPNVARRLERKKREKRIQEMQENEAGSTDEGLLSNVRSRWASPEADFNLVLKNIFGIGPRTDYSPASRLIYPLSPFAIGWMAVTCAFLLYTAIVTPAVIAFHWLDDACQSVPTLYFDCTLDAFFLLDILLSFNLGVIYQGQYYDDRRWVTWNYLKGSFFFDVFTSIPVSFVELSVKFSCEAAAASGQGANADSAIDPTQLRFIRAMKPLRWFKLARIIKLNSSGNQLAFALDYIGMEPRDQRLAQLAARIIGLIHLGACAVWLIKVISHPAEDITEFLAANNWGTESIEDISTMEGKLKAYSICTYFVTTVFSTVGFGDMSATNALERFFYSALMLYGILVFGNLLSELAELNHAARSEELTKMESVQAAVDFMAGHDVPFSLNNEVLRWTRFHHAHSTSNVKKKDFLDRLPKNLQAELVTIVFGDVLTKVPLFDMLQEEDHSFLMEVWSYMDYATFTPDSPIVDLGEPADRLIVVISGQMTVYVEDDSQSRCDTCTFKAGDFLGDFALLGDADWGSSTLINVPSINIEAYTIPEHFAVCLVLSMTSFNLIMDSHDFEMREAIERFQQQRFEHRMEALRHAGSSSMLDAINEAESFAKENKAIVKWGRFAKNLRKKKCQNDASDSFFKKLHKAVHQHPGESKLISQKAKEKHLVKSVSAFQSKDVLDALDEVEREQEQGTVDPLDEVEKEQDEDNADQDSQAIEIIDTSITAEIGLVQTLSSEARQSTSGVSLERTEMARIEGMFAHILARMDAQDSKIEKLAGLYSKSSSDMPNKAKPLPGVQSSSQSK